MSLPVPRPIVFDLNVMNRTNARSEYLSAELASTGGTVAPKLVFVCALLQTITPSVRLYLRHGDDPAGWVLLIVALSLVAILATLSVWRSRRSRPFAGPAVATVVSFENAGLTIERTDRRGARTTRGLPFERIRDVRLLPSAVAISRAWQPLLVIPRAALPDDGAELMAYLDDRLTGKRMLVRSSARRAAVANGSVH